MTIEILPKHIQEILVALYLRLNGFYTSGHILHADLETPAIREKGDIDVFAVRLPFSSEPETGVLPSEYLGITNGVMEILIGEVKSGREPIQFNDTLRDPSNLVRVLRRAGFTNSEKTLEILAHTLTERMAPQPINNPENRIKEFLQPEGDILYPTHIRPVIFHLGYRLPRRNQAWFVGYEEIMSDIWKRLRKEYQPNTCQREYDIHLWGPVYDAIASYFKDTKRNEPGTSAELVRTLLSEPDNAVDAAGVQVRV